MLIKGTDVMFISRISDKKGPMDLTGASVSLLVQRGKNDTLPIECQIIDAVTGNVQAELSKEVLSKAGTYQFQIVIKRENGKTSKSFVNGFFVGDDIEPGVI